MNKITTYNARDGQEISLSRDMVRKYLVSGRSELVTDQEIIMFMGLCRSRGLNPFARDCYLVKYDQSPAAIIVSRGYYQARAKQQPDCQGWNSGIIVRTQNGLEYREGHLLLDDEELVGGWFEAQPKGWVKPKRHTVPVSAYIKRKRDGSPTQFWTKEKRPMMIEKVAEIQGLRSLWAGEFSGLYVAEEVGSPEAPRPAQKTASETLSAKIEAAGEQKPILDPSEKKIVDPGANGEASAAKDDHSEVSEGSETEKPDIPEDDRTEAARTEDETQGGKYKLWPKFKVLRTRLATEVWRAIKDGSITEATPADIERLREKWASGKETKGTPFPLDVRHGTSLDEDIEETEDVEDVDAVAWISDDKNILGLVRCPKVDGVNMPRKLCRDCDQVTACQAIIDLMNETQGAF